MNDNKKTEPHITVDEGHVVTMYRKSEWDRAEAWSHLTRAATVSPSSPWTKMHSECLWAWRAKL